MSATRRTKKRDKTSFTTFSRKNLKLVHPDTGINAKAMSVLDDMLKDYTIRIIDRATSMTARAGKSTLSAKQIQCAVRYEFSLEMSKHAVSEGIKSVTRYNATEKGSSAIRAGLIFPPSRFVYMMKSRTCLRVSKSAGVYLAAVIEYLSAELLESSGNSVITNKRVRITPRDIYLAVKNDEDYNKMFNGTGILFSGTMPHIRKELLPKGQA